MKNSTLIYLSLVLSVSLVSNAEAAKENYDRSKNTLQSTNGLDNDCESIKNKDTCKPKQLTSKSACKPSNSARCPKPFGHVTVLKAKEGHVTVLKAQDGHVTVLKAKALPPKNKPQTKGTQATDYNSSRSNKADN